MALKVGELYASFGIDTSGVNKSLSTIQQQCNGLAKGLAIGGVGLTAAITKPLVGLGKSIFKAGSSFQSQMSRVTAIAGLDSSVASDAQAIEQLTQAALEMGSTTSFTASEAGEALEYMAMAGWKTDSMLAGLRPIMDLAAASGVGLGKTSDIVTDAMTAFGYTLENCGGDTEKFNTQVQHFSDVLASVSTNANTNVDLLGESFKYVASNAGALGFSVDDVAVALGLMANRGIKGSQAGTGLNRMLQNLIKPSESASIAMEKLGLSLYDQNGKIKDFSTLMGDMRTIAKESGVDMHKIQAAVAELDEQLEAGTITEDQYNAKVKELADGSEDFMRDLTAIAGTRGLGAMLAIMNASDEEFDSLTEAIMHCDGATARMAATMLDNAQGSITLFKSALEGLEITLFTIVAEPFQAIVEKATEYVDAFRKMDKRTQTAALKMAGLAAAAGPVMGILAGVLKVVGGLGPMLMGLMSPLGIIGGGFALMAIAAVDANNDIGRTLQKGSKTARRHLTQLNKGILGTFETISKRLPNLTQSLRNILQDDLPTLIDTAGLTITGFARTIAENSSNILSVGIGLIKGLATGISRNLPLLFPSLVSMMASIRNSLIAAIPTILQAGAEIAAGLFDGMMSTDWTGEAGKFIGTLSDAFSGTLNVLDGVADGIVSAINDNLTPEKIAAGLSNATQIAESIFTAIITSLGTLGDKGSEIITKLVGAINTIFDGIGSDQFEGSFGTFVETLITGIANALISLGTAESKIVTSLVNGVTSVLTNISESDFDLASLASTIFGAITTAITRLGTAGTDNVTSVVTAISGLLNTITGASFTGKLGELATAIIGGIMTSLSALATAGGDILTTIVNGISSLLSTVTSSDFGTNLNTIAEAIITAICTGLTTLGTTGSDIITTLVTSIGGLLGKITSEDFTSGLGNVATTLITGLGTALGSAATGGANIISGLATMLSNALSGGNISSMIGNLAQLGAQIITAIGEGIKNAAGGASALITAIGTLISTALGGGEGGTSAIGDLSSLGSAIITAVVQAIQNAGSTADQIITALSGAISSIGWAEAGADLGGLAANLVTSLATAVSSQSFTDVVTQIATAIGGLSGSMTSAAEKLIQGLVTAMLNPALWAGLVSGIGIILKTTLESARAAIDKWQEEVGLKKTVSGIDVEGKVNLDVYLNGSLLGGGGYGGGQFGKYLQGQGILSYLGLDDNDNVIDYTIAPEFEYLFDGEHNQEWLQLVENYRADLEGREPETITVEQPVEIEATSDTGEDTDVVQQFTDTVNQQLEAQGITSDPQSVSVNVSDVTTGNDTEIQSNAQTAVDTALAAVSLTADVAVAASVTVNVSDTNASSIGESLGEDLGGSLATGITNKRSAVGSAAASLATTARWFIEAVASSAYTSGANFGQSFANGILSKVAAARAAGQQLGAAGRAGVGGEIQEGSPAKRLIESGQFFGEGFAIGIGNRLRMVSRASRDMARTAVEAMSIDSGRGIFGMANRQQAIAQRNAVDYNRMAMAFSAAAAASPQPVLELDGKQVAQIQAERNTRAQNARMTYIATRYGTKR